VQRRELFAIREYSCCCFRDFSNEAWRVKERTGQKAGNELRKEAAGAGRPCMKRDVVDAAPFSTLW
jgi:hypothetical protein